MPRFPPLCAIVPCMMVDAVSRASCFLRMRADMKFYQKLEHSCELDFKIARREHCDADE